MALTDLKSTFNNLEALETSNRTIKPMKEKAVSHLLLLVKELKERDEITKQVE